MELILPSGARAAAPATPLAGAALTPTDRDTASTRRGFAWWRVTPDGWLETHPGIRWTTEWTRAECAIYPRFLRARWRRLHPAGVPGAFCHCGIRAVDEPFEAHGPTRRMPASNSGVGGLLFGAVEAAGPFALDARGWRAAAARPLALFVAPDHLRGDDGRIGAVASRYGLPILRDLGVLRHVWGPQSLGPDHPALAAQSL